MSYLVFVLAPLPFGSTDLIWVCAWAALLAASLLTADLGSVTLGHLRLLLLPVFVMIALLIAVTGLQLSPDPLIGRPNPVWGVLRESLHVDAADRISVTTGAPWIALGYPLLLAMSLARAFLLATDAPTARQLMKILARAGLCYAAFGIFAQIAEPTALLLRQKDAYLGFTTGTFVNRNTAATFWGSSALLFLLPLLHTLFRGPLREGPLLSIGFLERIDRALSSPKGLVVGFLACTTAAAMTGSRAGVLLTAFACLLASALYLGRLSLGKHRRWLWIACAAAAGAALLQLTGGLVFGRIASSGLVDESRLGAYRGALAIIRDYPLFGVGLGNFETIFPYYRPAELGSQGIWDRAHSLPLEIAVDLGLPAAVLIGLCALWYLYHLLRGSLLRRRDRYIPIAGATVGLLGILHSSIDFSLQIPGYGVFWAAIVGCGLGQCLTSEQKSWQHCEQ